MTVPSTYTPDQLKAFMLAKLSRLNDALGWTSFSAEVTEAVTDTLLLYGVTSVSDAADIGKLRTLAQLAILRAAASALAAVYDFDEDGQSFKRSQIAKALATASGALGLAEERAAIYLVTTEDIGAFEIVSFDYTDYPRLAVI